MANRSAPRPPWQDEPTVPTSRWGPIIVLGLAFAGFAALFIWALMPGDPPRTQFALIEITQYGEDYPKLQPSWSLEPGWDSNSKSPNNKDAVQKILSEIPAPERDQENNDTLFLVLRCYAAVDSTSNAEPTCQLLIGESKETHYPMKRFLEDTLQRGYQNTVVIADVCDLHYAPYLNTTGACLIVNPLVNAIQKDCETLDEKFRDRRLWVLIAAADGQQSFRDRDGRTLFREGIVKTLQSDDFQNNPSKDFSLNDLYRQVGNFCGDHSHGLQTPIRIAKNFDSNNDSSNDRVSLFGTGRKPWYTPPKPEPEDTAEKKESAEDSETRPEKAQDQDPKSPPSSETNGDIDELEPWLIDPLAWRLAVASNAIATAEGSVEEPLADRIPRGENRNPREQAIEETWKNEKTSRLTDTETQRWKGVRDPLREYLKFVAQWVAWRDLALSYPKPISNSNPSDRWMEQELRDADEALKKRRASLKLEMLECNDEGNWLANLSEGSLASDRSDLKESFDKLQSQLVRALPRSSAKPKSWSWLEEQQLIALLESPLLDIAQRKKLVEVLRKTKTIPKTLPDTGSGRSWANDANNSSMEIERRRKLFEDTRHWTPCPETPKSLLSQWYERALQPLPPDPDPSKIEPRFHLFYPGNPNEKRLALSPRSGEGRWIDLDSNAPKEKRFDLELSLALPGDLPKDAILRWRQEGTFLKLGNTKSASFRVRWEDGSDWKPEELKRLAVSGGSITITTPIEPNLWGYPDDRLVFEWCDDQGQSLARDSVPILVNAERIDVVLDPQGEPKPIYPNRDGDLRCSFPAIQDALVRWDIQLRNKIDKRRSARVIVAERNNGVALAQSKPIDWEGAGSVAVEFEPVANSNPNSSQQKPPEIRGLVFRVQELETEAPLTSGLEGAIKEPKVLKQWPFHAVLQPENPGSYVEADPRRGDLTRSQAFDLPLQLNGDFWNKVPDMKSVPMVVRWKPSNEAAWERYSSEILRDPLKSNPANTTSNRPVLQPGDNDILFECDLGGYPRAVWYRLKCSFPDSGSASPAQPDLKKTPQARITRPAVKGTAQDSEQLLELTPSSDGSWIFPVFRWENWENKAGQKQPPTKYQIRGLAVQAIEGIDAVADGLVHWQLRDKSGEILSEGSFPDRSVTPEELTWEGPTLSFKPRIGEADTKIAYDFDGSTVTPYEFRISTSTEFEDEPTESTSVVKLIMDRDPPKPGKLQGNGKLRGAVDNQISVVWTDEPDRGGAGIAEGYLQLQRADTSASVLGKYDFKSAWKLNTKGEVRGSSPTGGKYEMVFDIKAADLEKLNKELPKGPIRVNALILDKAGNYQIEHESLVLDWEPAPAP